MYFGFLMNPLESIKKLKKTKKTLFDWQIPSIKTTMKWQHCSPYGQQKMKENKAVGGWIEGNKNMSFTNNSC